MGNGIALVFLFEKNIVVNIGWSNLGALGTQFYSFDCKVLDLNSERRMGGIHFLQEETEWRGGPVRIGIRFGRRGQEEDHGSALLHSRR
jgi:hypothetical protein